MGIFSSFRQQVFPSYLGVDLGTTSIKIVEVKNGSRSPQLVNYGFLESNGHLVRANRVIQTSSFKIFEADAADMLKDLVSRMKPGTDVALASLPSFAAFTTVLDFPELKPSELEQALVYQAKQYIPIPLSEVALDWLKVGEYQDEKGFKHQQILLISVAREHIEKYQKIFKMAGLRLTSLEIEGLSMIRALIATDRTPTVIIDIGGRSTSVVFTENGGLKFVAQTDFAGASITQSLATSLHVSPLRAEDLKRERGITGTGPNYELSTIMLPFLDVILSEVKKAFYSYQTQFPKSAKIERAILSGGGANLSGIEKYAQRELNIPVVKASTLFRFEYASSLEPLVADLSPLFSVASGLVLKEFI